MSQRITKLNRDILKSVCDSPGQTITQIVDHFSEVADKTTIRHNIYKLGALGYLSLRDETIIYPTEKGKKLVGKASDTSKGCDDQ